METGIEELFDDLMVAFRDTEKPSVRELVDPRVRAEGASARRSPEEILIERWLGPMEWHDIEWEYFAWDDELIQGPTAPADYACAVFNALSNPGASYFAPSVMLIVISEGSIAEGILNWLVDRLDPEWVGLDWVEEAFGSWSLSQVDVLVRFLDWALAISRNRSYDEQDHNVLKFWKERRTQLACR
jgi:hypothetical protein